MCFFFYKKPLMPEPPSGMVASHTSAQNERDELEVQQIKRSQAAPYSWTPAEDLRFITTTFQHLHTTGIYYLVFKYSRNWCALLSGFCCVCHVFPPHVSIFGLFPVLVKCHYELILVQPCLSNYLWFTCVFIVLSVQFDLVWSTRYSPVFLSMSVMPCLAQPCLDLLKTVNLSLRPRLRVPVPPSCVHRDNFFLMLHISSLHLSSVSNYQVKFPPLGITGQ